MVSTTKNVVDSLFDEMVNLILTGEWPIGSKIPSENELTARWQVSRNSLRQALNRFNALGIIESRHGDGSYVKAVDLTFYLKIIFPMIILSKYDALNVYQLQKAIQIEAASGDVCKLVTPAQLDEMDEMVKEMKRCDKLDDEAGFLAADMRYHEVFVEISRNPVLISIEQCLSKVMKGPLSGIVSSSKRGESILAHEKALEALKDGNSFNAHQWMTTHMSDVVYRLERSSKQLSPAEENTAADQ